MLCQDRVAYLFAEGPNPIKYAESLQDVGIDPTTPKWKPMPEQQEAASASSAPASKVTPLTIPEAKDGLSLPFGVPPDKIEITIRG